MKQAGRIVLVPFPFTNLSDSKLRPVLVLRPASFRYDDWLVCMISSQLHQAEPHLDEIVTLEDNGFQATGLKGPSVFRLSRLAVVEDGLIAGSLGEIGEARLQALRQRLAAWLVGA